MARWLAYGSTARIWHRGSLARLRFHRKDLAPGAVKDAPTGGGEHIAFLSRLRTVMLSINRRCTVMLSISGLTCCRCIVRCQCHHPTSASSCGPMLMLGTYPDSDSANSGCSSYRCSSHRCIRNNCKVVRCPGVSFQPLDPCICEYYDIAEWELRLND